MAKHAISSIDIDAMDGDCSACQRRVAIVREDDPFRDGEFFYQCSVYFAVLERQRKPAKVVVPAPDEPTIPLGQVLVQGFRCRCGHEWLPRQEGTPRICPKCKSAYWDRPKRAH